MSRLLVNVLEALLNTFYRTRLYPRFYVLEIARVLTPQSCTCTKQSVSGARQTGYMIPLCLKVNSAKSKTGELSC